MGHVWGMLMMAQVDRRKVGEILTDPADDRKVLRLARR